jgi:ATP-dependent Lhr-like helicase
MLSDPPLSFHPLVNAWFTETYGRPTPVQEEAWPLILRGEHVLALAPTGSGKTLTAFLAAISRFADGTYPADKLSVLYVSPLKALNEDIRRNLTFPLEGIRARFERAGESFPDIRTASRSGDTPPGERRRFLLRPPSILALTPESLAIILLNPRGREVLSSVRCLILDEIHASLGTKRGSFLSCQVDRLSLAAGEFQRIALSATVEPPELAATFAGGLRPCPSGGFEKRELRIAAPRPEKKIEVRVEFPPLPEEEEKAGTIRYGKRYKALVNYIVERIRVNRTEDPKAAVLVFTDSRRRAERISYLINQTVRERGLSEEPWAFTHHGSLSREVRREVEKALAGGSLPCVAATSSLELGIDIGSVNEVILAGSPASSAQALQRIGRSGHGVGLTSRAALLPFHGQDLLAAAALAGAVEAREIEASRVIENSLDILAQIILALCAEKERQEDELYELIRGFYVYRNLSRSAYDGVVRMLAGAYEGTRLRELRRRVYRDGKTKTLTAAAGALLLLYTSGGVIPSRGNYSLRLAPDTGGAGTKIGELDEEFVWERRVGDNFDFGGRSWRISAIGPEAVEVVPLPQGADFSPFWRAGALFRSPLLSRRILEFLDKANAPVLPGSLKVIPGFSPEAGEELEAFLASQKSVQGEIPLSGPAFIAVEIVDDQSRGDARLVVLHTFRGGAVNYPLSMTLAGELEEEFSLRENSSRESSPRIEAIADDNALLLRIPRSLGDPGQITGRALKRLGERGRAEKRLKERLESSGIFGAAFREAAERALVLPRGPFGKRVPLWMIRQRSKRLFEAAGPYGDFPVSAEAWRTVLEDQFDMEGFRSLIEDIQDGIVALGYFTSPRPSPFSRNLAWAETNILMYEYDETPGLKPSAISLSDEAIAEALGNPRARPSLPPDLVKDFGGRLRREIPGWAPEDALALSEWVKERIAIPSNGKDEEWEKLMEALPEGLGNGELTSRQSQYADRLVLIKRPGAAVGSWVHREWAEIWENGKPERLAEECLAPWLRCQGPVPLSRIREVFGFSRAQAEAAADALEESGKLVKDAAVGDVTGLVCDRDNLELLLRLSRRKRRAGIRERPLSCLIPYLALRQGIIDRGKDSAGPSNTGDRPREKPWETLAGFAAPVRLWETEIFPARLAAYEGAMLDREIGETRLLWYGAGKEKAGFCGTAELDLVLPPFLPPPFPDKLISSFFDTPRGFWEIKDALGLDSRGCAEALWQAVWKGLLSADSWEPLRRALDEGFSRPPGSEEIASGGRLPRALRERWRLGPPVRGNWFSLASGDPWEPEGGDRPRDLLEEEELRRGRVRLLLRRWGVLCRPLLEREAPPFSWSALLPAMRRMELAGELVAGRFFSGINSLQFASPRIGEELEEAEGTGEIFWMNAADPVSLSGLPVPQGIPELPPRLPSARLCFKGSRLIAASSRSGKSLEIRIPPGDGDLAKVAEFAAFPRRRAMHPEKKILIEKINGKTAALGEYAEVFKEAGFVNDRGKLVLW